MKLTVLGSCGGYPRPGRACSGYLVQCEGSSLVMDLGTGTMANMLKHVSFEDLDGIALTHLHPDHFVDLYAIYTARRFSRAAGTPLPVVAPPGSVDAIKPTVTGNTRTEFFEYLHFMEARGSEEMEAPGGDEMDRFEIGPFRIEAVPARHSVPSMCLRVTAGGRTICYTGDTDSDPLVVKMARGCDLFLCEATFTSQLPMKIPGHLYASEAGEMARQAGAGRLVLTHVWPTLEEGTAGEDAAEAFEGPIELAVEGLVVEI